MGSWRNTVKYMYLDVNLIFFWGQFSSSSAFRMWNQIPIGIPKRFHTVREWFYNGHKLPRTLDGFFSLYNINAYKKSLQKLIWTKKKNQLPERGIEPATLQIFQKQGKFDLNAITTWPRRPLLEGASNLNIAQYSTKFH